jgi:menaquinone-dependent protoporphyrinogen IX oxidase
MQLIHAVSVAGAWEECASHATILYARTRQYADALRGADVQTQDSNALDAINPQVAQRILIAAADQNAMIQLILVNT